MNPRVLVLLSAYNGKKYIKDQVYSILNQEQINVSILIRDDGSIDGTYEYLLNEFGSNVFIIKGNNIGSTNSFLELISNAGKYDYYSFSDQDDVWDSDKLICAINNLIKYDKVPAVYSSNTRLVDDKLKRLKNEDSNPKLTLGSAIIKNYATGCTMVFNSMLMNKLKMVTPKNAVFHDWWVNLVCLSIGGKSIYDIQPHMSYRQHGNNVVGAPINFMEKWKSRYIKFRTKVYHREIMASEIIKFYEAEINVENIKLLKSIADYPESKIKLLLDKNLKTGNLIDDFLFRVCVWTGRI